MPEEYNPSAAADCHCMVYRMQEALLCYLIPNMEKKNKTVFIKVPLNSAPPEKAAGSCTFMLTLYTEPHSKAFKMCWWFNVFFYHYTLCSRHPAWDKAIFTLRFMWKNNAPRGKELSLRLLWHGTLFQGSWVSVRRAIVFSNFVPQPGCYGQISQ